MITQIINPMTKNKKWLTFSAIPSRIFSISLQLSNYNYYCLWRSRLFWYDIFMIIDSIESLTLTLWYERRNCCCHRPHHTIRSLVATMIESIWYEYVWFAEVPCDWNNQRRICPLLSATQILKSTVSHTKLNRS